MSLAAKIVYDPLLSGEDVGGNPAPRNNVLALIQPATEQIKMRVASIWSQYLFFQSGKGEGLGNSSL